MAWMLRMACGGLGFFNQALFESPQEKPLSRCVYLHIVFFIFTLARLRAAVRSHEIQDAVSSILSTLVVIDRQLFKFFSVIPGLELSGIQEMNALGNCCSGKSRCSYLVSREKKNVSRISLFSFGISRFTFHAFAMEDLACSSVSCIEKYFSIPPSFSTRFT